jgi:hypothetical protein
MKIIIYLILLVFSTLGAYSQTVTIPSGSTARATQAYTKNDSIYFQLGTYGSVRVPVYQDVQYKTVQTLVQRNAIPSAFRKVGMMVWVSDVSKHFVLSAGISNSNWAAPPVDISGKANLAGGNSFTGDQNIAGNLSVLDLIAASGGISSNGTILSNGGIYASGGMGAENFYTITEIEAGTNIKAIGNITGANLSGINTGDQDLSFNATTPSTSSVIGINGVTLGTNTIAATLQALLYPSQPPTATLTGGLQLELMASGADLPYTLNWSGSRQGATQNLSSIVVASVAQTFTNPSAPGTVSGTQAVSVTRNTNVTYANVVTTADGKTNTSTTTSFNFFPRKYWGRSATNSPSNADLLAALGGGSEFGTAKAKTSFNITASGTNFIFYAYPTSFGLLSSLTIGGFESLPTFTQSTVSVTNASGFVQNYYIYTSNNAFSSTASNIIAL